MSGKDITKAKSTRHYTNILTRRRITSLMFAVKKAFQGYLLEVVS